jgi:drug/metabolite transporter (DMT)-like permease
VNSTARKPAWLAWGCFAAIVLLWGPNWLVIKVGLGSIPPLTYAGLRYFGAALVVLPLALLVKASFPRAVKDWLVFSMTGLLAMGATGGFLFFGQQFLASGLGSLLFALAPFTTALAAHFVIADERLSWRRLSGIAIGFVGVGLVVSQRGFGSGSVNFLGAGAMLLSTVAWAAGTVWFKKTATTINPLASTGIQLLSGGAGLLILGLILEWGQPVVLSPTNFLLLGYMIVPSTALGYCLYFWMLRYMPATWLALVSFLVPIVAVLMGVSFLAEPLTLQIGLAIPLVGLGLFLVQGSSRATASSSEVGVHHHEAEGIPLDSVSTDPAKPGEVL